MLFLAHPFAVAGSVRHGLFSPEFWFRLFAFGTGAGYVASIVDDEKDLEPAMDLIRLLHHYFAGKQNALC